MKLFGILAIAMLVGTVSSSAPDVNKRKAEFRDKKPPNYSNAYILAGYLELPYAEIHEPFTVYFDPKNNRSRVDYYDSMVKTMQLGGAKPSMVKIAYMTTDSVYNQLNCFQITGYAAVQAGVPDLTSFKYMGQSDLNGRKADQWQLVQQDGSKKSTYTFFADTVTAQPFRYDMMGYDTLFGSHYDRYYIDYTYYSATQPSDDVFQLPSNLTCHGFPGPGSDELGSAERAIEMNPMAEYVDGSGKHHDEMFDSFKRRHGKQYSTDKEHATRKAIFTQNVRFIQSTNRQSKSYKVAVNHLADRSGMELKIMRGFRRTKPSPRAQAFDPKKHNLRGIQTTPSEIDWRLYGAVAPVKDQAVCGSCWSFGTTGTLEGTLFLKTGTLTRLSQQELMDCSWGEGNNACDGGEDWRAYEWISNHGLTSEDYYGPYLSQDGKCHSKNVTAVAKITGYVNVSQNDETALRSAIAMNGPISVAIDASQKSFTFYSNGVYYDPNCKNGPDQLDHAVLAVGYGTLEGKDYWLVKNSWSTYWGNDGYILMSPKDNNCGVMTTPTFATM